MQIKIEAMKNMKTQKTEGKRDEWRHVNKAKTLKRKVARAAKRYTQAA